MGKWQNWEMEVEYLKPIFDEQIEKWGKVKIYTNVDHVSSSGMTAWVSAYVAGIDDSNGRPFIHCIAREVRVGGCGFSRGHHLAYHLYHNVYRPDDPPYQNCMEHCYM